ncbi:ATP-grasp domain-containing protein [Asanoa sp. WMMD1127]|uniref:ATP-grasp domain-containing protein n=1 Tax=Asanoa sp. WMMD1127 TaxID=3016107 RepID=UPI0024161114|nr:ATP-grasp domain-containing protein [Asanoa sp. WMMD1127]MDG4824695.1 ATP-grasp domain-containing protein [Asanoa sp. WMMD1127]
MTPTRVLVTGAGGPAGIAVIRSLSRVPGVTPVAADMDPYAAGLYLVDDRALVPAGAAPSFVPELLDLCRRERVDVVVPTVDDELLPLAGARGIFRDIGVRLALTGTPALECTLDKLALARRCAATVHTPRTEMLSAAFDPAAWEFPVILKPRRGSGSRGVRLVTEPDALGPPDEALIVQEHLPGDEYSLDVLADVEGRVVSVVPRRRTRVDSGVSVAGETLHDPELDALARGVFAAVGLSLVANVQCRRDRSGRAALLEVNPRFSGAMPLTIHSGVDMPLLCLDAVLGGELPDAVPHRPVTMVRFLEERFLGATELVTV